MKRTLYTGAAVVASGLLLLLQANFRGGLQTRAATAQGENVIVRVASPSEPVEVVKLQVGGEEVAAGSPSRATITG